MDSFQSSAFKSMHQRNLMQLEFLQILLEHPFKTNGVNGVRLLLGNTMVHTSHVYIFSPIMPDDASKSARLLVTG